MRFNWRYHLKGLLGGVVVAYVGLNLISLFFHTHAGIQPVAVVVSVYEADTSKPVSDAVASWQDCDLAPLDCPRIVELLSDHMPSRSSNAGVLSPNQGLAWHLALLDQRVGIIREEGIPGTVIGMTPKSGQLRFRACFPFHIKWRYPRLGDLDPSDRFLQIDAVGYKTESKSLRSEDFRVVDGAYTVNVSVYLEPDTM
jgi:hypothetical protein